MSENASDARRNSWRRIRTVSLFAICLIVLTALLELGLVANSSF